MSDVSGELKFQYGSNRPGWVAQLGVVALAVTVLASLWQFARTGAISVATPFWIIVSGFVILLPKVFSAEVVADSSGIHARPYINVGWDQVAYVIEPSVYDEVVRIHLVNGSDKVTGFPPSYASRLAAIGGKDLRRQ